MSQKGAFKILCVLNNDEGEIVMKITEYRSYQEAKDHFKWNQIWELFDGNEEEFNIAHECIDRHPGEKKAVSVKFDDGHIEKYSFEYISALSSQFANVLESRRIDKGDRIAIMLDPCLEFYVSLFGVLKRGAIVVPCFPLFGHEALQYRLNDSNTKLLITSSDKTKLVGNGDNVDVIITGSAFFDLLKGQQSSYKAQTSSKDFSIYQYTSGTTKKFPDAIKHSHKSLAILMPAAIFGRGLKKGDRYFCPSSPAWGHGLWHGTFSPLALGIGIGAYSGKFQAQRFLEALEELDINNVCAASTVYRQVKNFEMVHQYNPKVEKIFYTGEAMDMDTFRFIEEKFGRPPYSGYGTTEVGSVLYQFGGFDDWVVKPGSLGKPMPGLEVIVMDQKGNELPTGETGEIAIRRNEKWVPSKDLAFKDEDGYFWYKGRADDVIISAGWTISPTEVEDMLQKHNAVQEAAVIGIPDKDRGKIIKAFVVINKEPCEELKKELQEFVKDNLSKHEYPREIEFMDSLPKTEGGKISRKILNEMCKKYS